MFEKNVQEIPLEISNIIEKIRHNMRSICDKVHTFKIMY